MTKSLSEKISDSRRLLKNPYAYLDGLGGYSALPHHDQLTIPSSNDITTSRRLLQDPYAYLDESGSFSALSNSTGMEIDTISDFVPKITNNHRYSHIEIEQQARDLHKRMWQNRKQIWHNAIPPNPIDMLDPLIALQYIGYNYDLDETLGQFHSGGKLVEVAGIIDKTARKVRISRQFQHNIRSFTAAHELGHALLHETSGLHRDRPLDGTAISRDAIEFEADKFATYFLMPNRLVKSTFKKFFLTDNFSLNEETTFALGFGDFAKQKNKCKTLRQLSRILASAESYNGLQFTSLANQFRVSTEAMAIRLEELELLSL